MGRLTRRRRAAGGFTLLETTVALAILAVGILAMLAVQVTALRQGNWGRHTTTAAQVARDEMELLSRLPWSDARVQPTAGWTAAVAVPVDVQAPSGVFQQQVFNLQWRIKADPSDTNLRLIDVRVLWNEAEARAGAIRRFAISSIKHDDPVGP